MSVNHGHKLEMGKALVWILLSTIVISGSAAMGLLMAEGLLGGIQMLPPTCIAAQLNNAGPLFGSNCSAREISLAAFSGCWTSRRIRLKPMPRAPTAAGFARRPSIPPQLHPYLSGSASHEPAPLRRPNPTESAAAHLPAVLRRLPSFQASIRRWPAYRWPRCYPEPALRLPADASNMSSAGAQHESGLHVALGVSSRLVVVYNCELVDEANRLIRLDALSCTSFGLLHPRRSHSHQTRRTDPATGETSMVIGVGKFATHCPSCAPRIRKPCVSRTGKCPSASPRTPPSPRPRGRTWSGKTPSSSSLLASTAKTPRSGAATRIP